MTRLVLVRHGETVWHSENRYAGSTDVALTPRGMAQAGQLATWAETAELSSIWSSGLSRARLTAEACAARSRTRVTVDHRLRELDFGAGEGLTAAEMDEQFPEARAAFLVDPVGSHLPGGEDPHAAAQRFVECLADIAARNPDGRVLVVAHSTSIRLALCQLIGVPLTRYRQLFPSLRNCALTELGWHDDEVSLLEFNTPQNRALPVAPIPPAPSTR